MSSLHRVCAPCLETMASHQLIQYLALSYHLGLLLAAFSAMPEVPKRCRSTLRTSAACTPCVQCMRSSRQPVYRAYS